MESRKYLPIKFYAELNGSWFAAMGWKFYKWFDIKRKKPCGRFGHKSNCLCCCQPIDKEHCYLSEDGRTAYCKCCGSTRIICSEQIGNTDLFLTRRDATEQKELLGIEGLRVVKVLRTYEEIE